MREVHHMPPKTSTPLPARTPTYLQQYSRVLNAAYRYERIQREVQDEQARVQYLDSLIGQERQTLAGLQQVFRAEPLSLEVAQGLLRDMSAADTARALAEARGAAAYKAGTTVSKGEASELRSAYAQSAELGYSTTEALLAGASPEKQAAILKALPSSVPAQDRAALSKYAASVASKKPLGTGGGGAAAAEQAKAVSSALEAAYFAGPTGIRGGYQGLAVVERRKLTAAQLEEGGDKKAAEALRKSGYATQQDALDAALESVRGSGDPQAIPDQYARDIYLEARNTQAYTNAERADFEQEVLDSRKRIAKLEGERASIAGAYKDPAQEAIKRELTARGYKFAGVGSVDEWQNRYLPYQNTPYYDVLLKADRLVDSAKQNAKPLSPTSKAQNMVATLTMQYERTGTKFDLDTLRKQLSKAQDLSPADIDDALSFIVAYRELGGDAQDPKQLEFLKQQEESEKRNAEAYRAEREQKALLKQREIDAAREDARLIEEKLKRTPAEVRAEHARDEAPGKYYARLRALGVDAEDARSLAVKQVPPPPAPRAAPVAAPPAPPPPTPRAPVAPPVAAPPAPEPGIIGAPFEEAGTPYSYRKTPEGYLIYKGGFYAGKAAPGSHAAQSIERVMAGQTPLRPLPPPPAPSPAPVRTSPAPAAPQGARELSDEELLQKLLQKYGVR
jgi:hypothetical protein